MLCCGNVADTVKLPRKAPKLYFACPFVPIVSVVGVPPFSVKLTTFPAGTAVWVKDAVVVDVQLSPKKPPLQVRVVLVGSAVTVNSVFGDEPAGYVLPPPGV